MSKGLGRSLAEGFAAIGHTVIGCSRSSSDLGRLTAVLGSAHDFAVVDVASDEQVRDWAGRIVADFGAPDLLINNAAVINRNAKLWQIDAIEFDRSMAINVSGTANVIRHFAPAMVINNVYLAVLKFYQLKAIQLNHNTGENSS